MARRSLGLCSAATRAFVEQCEFLSLGCYCAPAYALQLLGLRKHSYPFDWTRTSLQSILDCIDARFMDFMWYSTYQQMGPHHVFGGTPWGGAFWHHNPLCETTCNDMQKRSQRFMGLMEVGPRTSRFFIRVVNAAHEIRRCLELRHRLQSLYAGDVYVVLVLEMQKDRGPVIVNTPDGGCDAWWWKLKVVAFTGS
ncbi:cyb5r2 [Symbiodinium sp. CCMP2592]|nr:cyb5r2 [Symbiodinium sp. CCMP2592]